MTFISVVLFDVDIGLYVGICTSFIINTIRTQKQVEIFDGIIKYYFSFVNRPRFVTLGQVGDTGIYRNIVYFPSVSEELVLFINSYMYVGISIFKNKNSSF